MARDDCAVRICLLLCSLLGACSVAPRPVLVDDFESGDLSKWRVSKQGDGNWFTYRDGTVPPVPAASDPHVAFAVPMPPQGKFAAVSDMKGPGRRVLYRDFRLEGRFLLRMIVFYRSARRFDDAPRSRLESGQYYRIDVLREGAPADSMEISDILATAFQTDASSVLACRPTPVTLDLSPWAGQTVRLRAVVADSHGPVRAGMDDIWLEPVGSSSTAARIQPAPACRANADDAVARDAAVGRLSETMALAELGAYAAERARSDELSAAVLVAKHGTILMRRGWGLADRARNTAIDVDTQFRIGSMNKMFTAVAILQLVEAGKVKLDEAIATYLPDYPNPQLANVVTVRQLLTHTGGTGDFFGAEFDEHRAALKEHSDYIALFGKRATLHAPGHEQHYSNYGFILLGAVIERVSGAFVS